MVTKESFWLVRILAWMKERYPPAMLILNVIVYFTTISIVQVLSGQSTITFDLPRDILGPLVFFCFPLILRIMDEHKDFEKDSLAHPDRVLQRGIVTLSLLRKIGWASVIFQGAFCIWVDQGFKMVTITWLITMVYSLLMAKEFFCGQWLEKRMMLYAISHQAITPIFIIWISTIPLTPELPPKSIWGFCLLALFSSFAFEISRKLRGPEDEREGVDTYTKAIGVKCAPFLALSLILCQALFCPWWLDYVNIDSSLSLPWLIANGAVGLIAILPGFLFLKNPTTKLGKALEGTSALMTLWIYAWLLSSCLIGSSVLWT